MTALQQGLSRQQGSRRLGSSHLLEVWRTGARATALAGFRAWCVPPQAASAGSRRGRRKGSMRECSARRGPGVAHIYADPQTHGRSHSRHSHHACHDSRTAQSADPRPGDGEVGR